MNGKTQVKYHGFPVGRSRKDPASTISDPPQKGRRSSETLGRRIHRRAQPTLIAAIKPQSAPRGNPSAQDQRGPAVEESPFYREAGLGKDPDDQR